MTNRSLCLECRTWEEFTTFIQEKLANENREAEFHNWIAPIQLLDESDDILSLEMPNIFLQKYFLENYGEVLASFTHKKINCSIKSTKQIEPQKVLIKTAVSHGLSPHYRFDNFIEGPSNQFVKSVAIGVASNPSDGFNPFVIHGGVGLGKTHILHAIGHLATETNTTIKIKYITTEEFVNELVKSLKNRSIEHVKKLYRSLDLLLIDDIQFLQKSPHFEEEFCNTLETLIQARKQVVITSDFPPTSLKLSERMVDRMKGGIIAKVAAPDLETRIAITKTKANSKGLLVESDIIRFIAENISHNVRQLEGAINKLLAYQALLNKTVTLELSKQLLNPMLSDKILSTKEIITSVGKLFSVKTSDIKSSSRKKEVVVARQVAMFLAKELLDDSLSTIAQSFGGKTHSTLIHAWKKIRNKRKKDNNLNQHIECLMKELQC